MRRSPRGPEKGYNSGVPLEMRPSCERCNGPLGHDAAAFICSYECTFCPGCAAGMNGVCPNCGGELVKRPRRRAAN
jgi:hypothetical protein